MLKTLATLVFIIVLSSQASAFVQHPDGSITLSKSDQEQLTKEINILAQQAFDAGAAKALEVLKSNPKLCPKDI